MAPGARSVRRSLAPVGRADAADRVEPHRAPLLNYPRITGATPGKPFMFLIPASGDEPLTFAAKNLPAGLTLDAEERTDHRCARAGRPDAGRNHDHQCAEARPAATMTIVGGDDALALTPPLGWNSWNAWGNTVTAERVRRRRTGWWRADSTGRATPTSISTTSGKAADNPTRPHDVAAGPRRQRRAHDERDVFPT